MLRIYSKRHKVLQIILLICVLTFGIIMGSMYYISAQTLAKQQQSSSAILAKMDKNIQSIKEKKAAELKAKREKERIAAQSAASDAALDSQLKGNIVSPAGCAAKGIHSDPNSIDIVVNKKRCLQPIDFAPMDLSSINGYVVSAKIVADLTAILNASAAAGAPISLTSSYRSYVNQVTTYNNWVRVNGSTAAADTVSARPGYSEHQTGFAVDLGAGGCTLDCFTGSAQYRWMLANGAAHGFIERYPAGFENVTGYSPESWHWRYVGKQVALDMKAKGIKTLEQYWNISGGSY